MLKYADWLVRLRSRRQPFAPQRSSHSRRPDLSRRFCSGRHATPRFPSRNETCPTFASASLQRHARAAYCAVCPACQLDARAVQRRCDKSWPSEADERGRCMRTYFARVRVQRCVVRCSAQARRRGGLTACWPGGDGGAGAGTATTNFSLRRRPSPPRARARARLVLCVSAFAPVRAVLEHAPLAHFEAGPGHACVASPPVPCETRGGMDSLEQLPVELKTPPLGAVALVGFPGVHAALSAHLRTELRPPLHWCELSARNEARVRRLAYATAPTPSFSISVASVDAAAQLFPARKPKFSSELSPQVRARARRASRLSG